MTWILLAMLGIVLVAGAVVLYVAFPHRGEEMPHTPWVGQAMRRGVEKLPTLDQAAVGDRSDGRPGDGTGRREDQPQRG